MGGLTFQQRHVDLPAWQRCVTDREEADIYLARKLNNTHAINERVTCPWLLTDEGRARLSSVSKVDVDTTKCKPILRRLGVPEHSRVMAHMKRSEVQLRTHSSDHKVFLQAFCGVSFRFLAGLVAYALPGRPLTVLDAGANIGLASMLFAHYIRFDGTIVAVDASPPTFDVMRANLRDLGPIVKPVLSAIMPTAEAGPGKTVKFGGRAGEFWGGVVLEAGQEKQEVVHEVPTTSLPHLAALVPSGYFDFIKLDIEGAEKKVLADPKSRAVLCKATCIFMELHERLVPGCQAAFNEFMATGCNGAATFDFALTTGEYIGICSKAAMMAGPRD